MPPLPQSKDTPSRGAAAVGQIDELPTLEIVAIMFLRLWCDGGASRARMMQDLTAALGPRDAATVGALFEDLMQITLSCARRPLMRHGVPCRCFGGDECAFANLIAAAVSGDREEAMLFSSILITGQAAYPATALAQDLSPYLLRFVQATDRANHATARATAATHPAASGTRH